MWPFLCSALPCGGTENLLSDAVLGSFLLDHLGFGTWPLLCSTLPCGGTENLRIGYYALSDTMLGSFLLATPVAGDHSELLGAGDAPGCLRWNKRSPRSRGQGPVLFCNKKNTTPVIACCTGGRSRTRVSRGRLCPCTSHVLMP